MSIIRPPKPNENHSKQWLGQRDGWISRYVSASQICWELPMRNKPHWKDLKNLFFTVSPRCIFKCLFILITLVALFDFFHCVFSNVSSKNLGRSMHCSISCIFIFPHCTFSNVYPIKLEKEDSVHWQHFYHPPAPLLTNFVKHNVLIEKSECVWIWLWYC